MMASSKFHFSILVFIAILIGIPTTRCHEHHDKHKKKKHVALFVFGDSALDAGNNNYINTSTFFRANFKPYGESFFKYPTGRFSDGRLICDFVAEYAKLPLIPPYLQPGNHQFANGLNFASAGAGALAETFAGAVLSLEMQISLFKTFDKKLKWKLRGEEAKKLLYDAVYLFSIGGNDYLALLVANSSIIGNPYAQAQYIDLVVGNTTAAIKEIYKKGGRKFGILGLPPLECIPSIRIKDGGVCMEQFGTIIKLHNNALFTALIKLQKELKGLAFVYLNLYDVGLEVINNSSKYGFEETKTACCGSGPFNGNPSCGGKRGQTEYQLCKNPSKYLFFDADHATQAAYQYLAGLLWYGSSIATGGYDLKSFFQ